MNNFYRFILLILLMSLFGYDIAFSAQYSSTPTQSNLSNLELRKIFLEYDYPETKDACKQFMTLVVGVLVFTLTFSEKIVNFHSASKAVKRILITGWVMFLLSIVLCGLGIGELLLAAGKAVYFNETYRQNASIAINLIISAGVLFILGLISLIINGIIMVNQNKGIAQKKNVVGRRYIRANPIR